MIMNDGTSRAEARGRAEPGPIVVHTRDLPAWVRPGWTPEDEARWASGDGLAAGVIAIVNPSHHEWVEMIMKAAREDQSHDAPQQ